MEQVIRHRPMPHVVPFDADVQQTRGELAILGAPSGKSFVVPVDLDYMVPPKRLIAALNASKR
jgi:hypothetical protein